MPVMSRNAEITERIIEALRKKAGVTPKCPLCGNTTFQVGGSYYAISVSMNPLQTVFGGNVAPLVPIICIKCGNTQLVNLLILGFSDAELKTMRYEPDARG